MKVLKKTFFLLIMCMIIFSCSSSESPVTTDEILRSDEKQQAELAEKNFKILVEKYRHHYVGRGAHAKGHACVKMYFDVAKTIQPELQHGVFSQPGKRYKGWIRFSNASTQYSEISDSRKDAHGMALKLLNIKGDTLTKAASGPITQDFLMADNPAFFSPDIDAYNHFLAEENYMDFFFPALNPKTWRTREFLLALETLKKAPDSPLFMKFFSNTAYKLGAENIKFNAIPCAENFDQSNLKRTDPDFLRKNLKIQLNRGDACFKFKVQLQDPEKNMPIEDPSIEWNEKDSPFITVATITIPSQQFDSKQQHEFCENLSFSPWHSLSAHQPVGQLNRIRKHVYQTSSDYRHEKNNKTIPENLDWK